MSDEVLWTWYDNLGGSGGEDELVVPPRTVTYTWSAARSDGTSPSTPSPVAVKPARGRKGLSDAARALMVGAVSIAILAANFWPKH